MKAFSVGILMVFLLLFNSSAALAETEAPSAYPALPADGNSHFVIYLHATGNIYLATFDKYNDATKDVLAGSKLKALDGSKNYLKWREYALAPDGSAWTFVQGPLADADVAAYWVVVFLESTLDIYDYDGNIYFQATSPARGEETPGDGDDSRKLTGLENALQRVKGTPAEKVIRELDAPGAN